MVLAERFVCHLIDYAVTIQWIDGPTNSLCWDNLGPGLYLVKITDLLCGQSAIVKITLDEIVESLPTPIVSFSKASCPSESNGILRLTTTGGKAPYQYLWDTGSTINSIYGLSPGICYEVMVTDDCGQSSTECLTLTE